MHGQGKQYCPERSAMLPCRCKDKKNGLDIVCEKVSLAELEGVTSKLKKYNQDSKVEYNVSLFYLKSQQ